MKTEFLIYLRAFGFTIVPDEEEKNFFRVNIENADTPLVVRAETEEEFLKQLLKVSCEKSNGAWARELASRVMLYIDAPIVKTLVGVCFRTQDSSCPIWTEVVCCEVKDLNTPLLRWLEVRLEECLREHASEYREGVEHVFNESGLTWRWFQPALIERCEIIYV